MVSNVEYGFGQSTWWLSRVQLALWVTRLHGASFCVAQSAKPVPGWHKRCVAAEYHTLTIKPDAHTQQTDRDRVAAHTKTLECANVAPPLPTTHTTHKVNVWGSH